MAMTERINAARQDRERFVGSQRMVAVEVGHARVRLGYGLPRWMDAETRRRVGLPVVMSEAAKRAVEAL